MDILCGLVLLWQDVSAVRWRLGVGTISVWADGLLMFFFFLSFVQRTCFLLIRHDGG